MFENEYICNNLIIAHERVPLRDALVGFFVSLKKEVKMKKKMILIAIIIVLVVGLLAYYQHVPFWASIVSTGAFLFGVYLGWLAKGWSDKHVV